MKRKKTTKEKKEWKEKIWQKRKRRKYHTERRKTMIRESRTKNFLKRKIYGLFSLLHEL